MPQVPPAERPPTRTFKPRRRALSATRQERFERLLPLWSVAERGPVLDLGELFGRDAPVVLDIGIGQGEVTIAMAIAQREVDVIACDVHTPGIAYSLETIERHDLHNVRLVHGDVLDFASRLPTSSLAGVRVFFPDPWPKLRQRHRRLVNPVFVDLAVSWLMPGGWIHFATDIDDYAEQIASVCGGHRRLRGGVIARPGWRPETRYERKGLEAGRRVTDLWYDLVD